MTMKTLVLVIYAIAAVLEGIAAVLAYRHSGFKEDPDHQGLYAIPGKLVSGTVVAAIGIVVALVGNTISLYME